MDMFGRQRLDELAAPKRNNYFYGKLLDELHLKLEQQYFIGKRAQLNRLALGSGVLCGLRVEPDGTFIKVSAGIAIDGFGREIVVPDAVRVDTARVSADCCTTRARDAKETLLYLKLCYRECKSDFVPAIVTDCLPEDRCAPSTIVESYCLELSVEAPPPRRAHNEALCEALRSGQTPEEKRAQVDAALAGSCGRVEGDGCVWLATVNLDANGRITDTAFSAPQHIYSNAALFDMLLCMGAGGEGPPGVGLDRDLPKILDVAWTHNREYAFYARDVGDPNDPDDDRITFGDFIASFMEVSDLATPQQLGERARNSTFNATNQPLFTIYFNRQVGGIDRHTFLVTLRFEVSLAASGPLSRPGIYFDLPLAGDVVVVQPTGTARTPHTNEPYATAAVFVPRPGFLVLPLNAVLLLLHSAAKRADEAELGFATFRIQLKGDFVTTVAASNALAEHAVLDADNIGGWVGSNHLRDPAFIAGGKNTSGNLTQGGDFESWIKLELGAVPTGSVTMSAAESKALMRTVRNEPESLPMNINLVSHADLVEAGLSAPQAERIVTARGTRLFAGEKDFQKRTRLQGAALRDIATKISML
ncbi:MAG: hypothetical protein ABI769_11165 [Pseudomonadota bacterium]